MQDILVDFRVQRFFLASERVSSSTIGASRWTGNELQVTRSLQNAETVTLFFFLHDLGEYKALYFHVFWRFVFQNTIFTEYPQSFMKQGNY